MYRPLIISLAGLLLSVNGQEAEAQFNPYRLRGAPSPYHIQGRDYFPAARARPQMEPHTPQTNRRRSIPSTSLNPYASGGSYGAPSANYGRTNSYSGANEYRPTNPYPSTNSYSNTEAIQRYSYTCEVDSGEDDAGDACIYHTYSRKSAGDSCRCAGQNGTIQ